MRIGRDAEAKGDEFYQERSGSITLSQGLKHALHGRQVN